MLYIIKIFQLAKTILNVIYQLAEVIKAMIKQSVNIHIVLVVIEMFFKSQKSNCFNLEKTRTRNLHAFENLYSIICFAGLWLSILAIDYTKNYAHVKKYLNIRYVKNNKNGKPIRILSIFNLGLTIFRRCFNSYINYKIKTNMQLYS